jgi:hypothetical protein
MNFIEAVKFLIENRNGCAFITRDDGYSYIIKANESQFYTIFREKILYGNSHEDIGGFSLDMAMPSQIRIEDVMSVEWETVTLQKLEDIIKSEIVLESL